MKIGLDFDGVISDSGKLKSDMAKKHYGLDIPPERFKREIVISEGYMTGDGYRDLLNIVYGTREAGLLMEPVFEMKESIEELLSMGHSVVVITSRVDEKLEIAKEWSLRQGIKLDFTGVKYGTSKAEACAGLDVFIDDDFDKLEPLVGVVPHRFLFSWGYNNDVETGNIAKRVHSWNEFLQNIVSLEDKR